MAVLTIFCIMGSDADFLEYPYQGNFYYMFVDKTKPYNEQTVRKDLILSTVCDIQGAQKSDTGGFIYASFNVYIPLTCRDTVRLKRGYRFEGYMGDVKVNGEIIDVVPTQLGTTIYLKDLDV